MRFLPCSVISSSDGSVDVDVENNSLVENSSLVGCTDVPFGDHLVHHQRPLPELFVFRVFSENTVSGDHAIVCEWCTESTLKEHVLHHPREEYWTICCGRNQCSV